MARMMSERFPSSASLINLRAARLMAPADFGPSLLTSALASAARSCAPVFALGAFPLLHETDFRLAQQSHRSTRRNKRL